MPPIPIARLRMKFFGYVPISILNTGISQQRFKVKSLIQGVIKNMLRIFLSCMLYCFLSMISSYPERHRIRCASGAAFRPATWHPRQSPRPAPAASEPGHAARTTCTWNMWSHSQSKVMQGSNCTWNMWSAYHIRVTGMATCTLNTWYVNHRQVMQRGWPAQGTRNQLIIARSCSEGDLHREHVIS